MSSISWDDVVTSADRPGTVFWSVMPGRGWSVGSAQMPDLLRYAVGAVLSALVHTAAQRPVATAIRQG
ncbi:hypothetical protein ACR6C2_18175 [Streptomyces sp. INA 01156]